MFGSKLKKAIRTLNDERKDHTKRCAAIETLVQIGAPAVEPLIQYLMHPGRMAREVIVALGEMRDPRAVEILARYLKAEPRNVFEGFSDDVIRSLVQIADRRAVAPICQYLLTDGHKHPSRLLGIVRALRGFGDPRAFLPIVAAVAYAHWCVWPEEKECMDQLDREVLALGDGIGHALVAVLKSKESPEQEYAARLLGRLGRRSVKALIAALADPTDAVREQAAISLGEIGDPRAVDTLIGVASQGTGRSHLAATASLAKFYKRAQASQAEGILKCFVALLRINDPETRQAALDALHKCGWTPKGVCEQAWYLCAREDVEALIEMGSDGTEALIGILDAKSSFDDDALRIVEVLSSRSGLRVLRALADFHKPFLGPSPARTTALRALERVISALGAIKDRTAVPALVELLEHDDCASCACDALVQILPATPSRDLEDSELDLAVDAEDFGVRELCKLARQKDTYEPFQDFRGGGVDDNGIPYEGHGYWETRERVSVSFSEVRRLAQQELLRRGRIATT